MRFIRYASLARDAAFIMLFDVARALEKRAPRLHVLEVDVFPEGPARVLDVQRTCAREQEDGVLDAGGVGGDVYGEEVEEARC